MDRASDSGSECWGFESLRACHIEKTLMMSDPRKRGFSIGQGLFSFPHAARFAGLARGPGFRVAAFFLGFALVLKS